MVPRKQAGHMTCTRPQAARQIPLATRASSTHDPELKSLINFFVGAIGRGLADPPVAQFPDHPR
jgi:hypothetical protein